MRGQQHNTNSSNSMSMHHLRTEGHSPRVHANWPNLTVERAAALLGRVHQLSGGFGHVRQAGRGSLLK